MHFYNDWALRILHGQWTDHQAFYGLPLYAYLLAGIYKIFGYSPFIPGLLQACLEAGTAVIIYRLGAKVFQAEETSSDRSLSEKTFAHRGQIVGIVAALGWAFFQPAEAYSTILMPTTWLVFIFWLLVWQVVKRDEKPPLPGIVFLGLIIGFTATGVATILFILPLLLLAIFCKWQRRGGKPSGQLRAAAAIALLVATLLGASPSFLHNYLLARDPVLLSAHSGINFWIGNNPWANGYPRFPPGLHAGQEAMLQDSITIAESATGHRLKRSEVSAYWSSKAMNYITHHFGAWLELLAVKVGNFWNAFRYDDLSVITTLREEGVIVPGLGFGLVAALAIPGLLLGCRRFPAARWVAAAILLHMVSLLSVFVTERYRLAAVPGLLLFASLGLWNFWQSFATTSYRRAATYSTLLIFSTFFVSIPKREPSLWALDSYNTGLQALDQRQLQAAEEKLDLAYAYVPDNAELNFALGNLRLAQGNKPAAKGYYRTTLRLDPRHEGTYNNLGVLALEESRWKLAANFFSKALEQNPREPKTYYLLARAHLSGGDLQRAFAEINQAISLDPTQPEFSALKQELDQKAAPP